MSTELLPGATQRFLREGCNHSGTRGRFDGVVLHTAASNGSGEDHYTYWNRECGVRVSSHFYVDKDGEITQLVKRTDTSWTSVEGCWRTIGIETMGWPTEPWTAAQVESLAQIIAWAQAIEGWPLAKMANTSGRGVGWHDMPRGSETWNPNGHYCPGSPRVAQIDQIIARAKAIQGGSVTPPVTPPSGGLASYQRRVSKTLGLNGRLEPNTYSAVMQVLDFGVVGDFDGWKYGEVLDGNGVWFRGRYNKRWFWSGGFEGGATTTGLTDLNGGGATGVRQRTVIAGVGVNGRAKPTTASAIMQTLPYNVYGDFDAYTHGENVGGIDIWFRGAYSKNWFWAGGFYGGADTSGLARV